MSNRSLSGQLYTTVISQNEERMILMEPKQIIKSDRYITTLTNMKAEFPESGQRRQPSS
jgi:hypothetical protein